MTERAYPGGAGEVIIGPSEEIVGPTGAKEVDADNIVELTEPYNGSILANDGSDVVALLTPNNEVVVMTDGTADPGNGNGDNVSGSGDDGGDGDGGDNSDRGDEEEMDEDEDAAVADDEKDDCLKR